MELLEVTTADGVRLSLRRFPPLGRRQAVVLLTHAMWANGGYFDRPSGKGLASHLARLGLEAFVLDFRGHGRSSAPAAGWNFDDYVRHDVPAAVRQIEQLSGVPASKLGWLGHSLGGLVAVAAAGVEPSIAPARLALVTANIWRRPGVLRRAVIGLFEGSARVLGRAPIRALRVGTDDEPAPYVSQLANWVRSGRFLSADGQVDYDALLHRVRSPVLVVVGGADPLCRMAEARDLAERLGSGERRYLTVSRANGFAFDATHFTLFTRPSAAPVWDELAHFFGAGANMADSVAAGAAYTARPAGGNARMSR